MIYVKNMAAYKNVSYLAIACLLVGFFISGEWLFYNQKSNDWSKQLNSRKSTFVDDETDIKIPELSVNEQELNEILAEPLFIEGRQTVAVIQQAEGLHEQFLKLTGVMMMGAQEVVALVQDDKQGTYRLREGDYVYGWKLSLIQRDYVTLIKNGVSRQLSLSDDTEKTVLMPATYNNKQKKVLPEEFLLEMRDPKSNFFR